MLNSQLLWLGATLLISCSVDQGQQPAGHWIPAPHSPLRPLLALPPGPLPPCRQVVSDHAHPPRAADVEELRQLQKSVPRERDEQQEERRTVSLSETLRSGARPVSPLAVVVRQCLWSRRRGGGLLAVVASPF